MNPRPFFTGPPKPFCPCDLDHPEECKPEEWPGAHSGHICTTCGDPSYKHSRDSEGRWHCVPKGPASPPPTVEGEG